MIRAALALLCLAGMLALIPAGDATARQKAPSTGYIVVYKGSVDDPDGETRERERRQGFKSTFRYRRAVKGFAARLSPRQLEELRGDPEVAFVSPDRRVEALGPVPLASGETAPTGIRRMEAATSTTARQASSVGVAVIDTGVDLDHPDLNALDGTDCITPGTSADDDNGHGSHVAGTIAARNTGSGVVGVVPGTAVHAVKVLGSDGGGTWSQVICGIDWVTANRVGRNIGVANMSLGGLGDPVKDCSVTTDALHKAICNSTSAGVVYAVAAGNNGWDFDYPSVPDVPAAYPQVLTVTAMTDSDGLPGGAGPAPSCRTGERDEQYASFSNYALTDTGKSHTIDAPGVCIRSTWPGGTYATISGTSMATPHIAGAVALCLGEGGGGGPCTGLTPDQIVQKMRGDADAHTVGDLGFGFTGDPMHPVSSRYYGYLTWVGTSAAGYPGSTVIQAGSLRSGGASSLKSDDNAYYQVNSTTSGTRTVRWYGAFAGVPATLRDLRVTYRGKNSRSCSQTVAIYRWTDGAWVNIDSRSVGTSEVGISKAPGGTLSSYVSGTGQLRVRLQCTRSSPSFYASADLLRISYQAG